MKTKIAIVGSRNFNDYGRVENIVKEFLILHKEIEIVSGGAKGADSLAEQVANNLNLDFKVFLPLHKKDKNVQYNPKYFFDRNKEIVEYSDIIIAFWDYKSKGTKHTIDYSKRKKKSVFIIKI